MEKCEQQFRAYIHRRGLKFTRERKETVNAIHSYYGHFDVEGLIFQMRKKGSRISRGTVYRTIPLLVEAKILRPVAFTDRHAHYEDTCKTRHHDHLICLGCGKVVEFYRGEMEKEMEGVCRKYNFQPLGHKMEITGYCLECTSRRKERNR